MIFHIEAFSDWMQFNDEGVIGMDMLNEIRKSGSYSHLG